MDGGYGIRDIGSGGDLKLWLLFKIDVLLVYGVSGIVRVQVFVDGQGRSFVGPFNLL